jgi:uroporphyrinogen decarboxylase
MTSKERVRRAIEFKSPDKLPMEFPEYSDSEDFTWSRVWTKDPQSNGSFDEWGCLWIQSQVHNIGQVKSNPVADWDSFSSYRFPDPDNPAFFAGMEDRAKGLNRDKYIKAHLQYPLFDRLQMLRGFENLMLDFYTDREKLEELADRLIEFDVRLIENISRRFPGVIDGIRFADDWGSEQNSFISAALFDDFFKPRYEKLFAACHKAGWHIWFHSCGKVTNLVPSLIDAGVNVFNFQQPNVLGIEEFGRQFAGKVCFSTLADIQRTLPTNDPVKIEAEVQQLVKYWAVPEGGLIPSGYGDGLAIGTTAESLRVMYEAFKKYG